MNVNENPPTRQLPANRIQRFSAILRTFFFATAVLAGIGGILEMGVGGEAHVRNGHVVIFSGCMTLTWSVLLWLAYRLFSSYARGNLFSSETASCLRGMGWVSIVIAFERLASIAFQIAHNPPNWAWTWGIVGLEFCMNISLGFAIICIARVMDEGRKIQEEQELTV